MIFEDYGIKRNVPAIRKCGLPNLLSWSRLPHCGYTLLSDSVAQQIERVSAASAVPPPTSLFSSKPKQNQIRSQQTCRFISRLLERRLQSSYEAQRRRVQFTWMSVRIRPESTYQASPRGLMDKASVSEAEDCGFESRRGYTQS